MNPIKVESTKLNLGEMVMSFSAMLVNMAKNVQNPSALTYSTARSIMIDKYGNEAVLANEESLQSAFRVWVEEIAPSSFPSAPFASNKIMHRPIANHDVKVKKEKQIVVIDGQALEEVFEDALKGSDAEGEEEEGKESQEKARRAPPAPLVLSPELVQFIGQLCAPKALVVRAVKLHIDMRKLHDPNDKQFVLIDDKLRPIFKTDRIGVQDIARLLSEHMRSPSDLDGSKKRKREQKAVARAEASGTGDNTSTKLVAAAKPAKKAKRPEKEAASSAKSKEKAKRPANPNSGINQLQDLSQSLAELLGIHQVSRQIVTKLLWDYIKKNSLQDTEDKRYIVCDAGLLSVFGTQLNELHAVESGEAAAAIKYPINFPDRFHMMRLGALLKPHLQRSAVQPSEATETEAEARALNDNDEEMCDVGSDAGAECLPMIGHIEQLSQPAVVIKKEAAVQHLFQPQSSKINMIAIKAEPWKSAETQLWLQRSGASSASVNTEEEEEEEFVYENGTLGENEND